MSRLTIFTIGFTQKSAEEFFSRLIDAGVQRVVDVRLNNVSQLAGFSKKNDLSYFLRAIGQIDYAHLSELAPTQAILDAYKKHRGDWSVYEREFLALMRSRRVEATIPRALLDRGCLLCSEATPEHCHRRLVAEYLRRAWGEVEIVHL
jgi:uncharacterized protein (DUF488 family)